MIVELIIDIHGCLQVLQLLNVVEAAPIWFQAYAQQQQAQFQAQQVQFQAQQVQLQAIQQQQAQFQAQQVQFQQQHQLLLLCIENAPIKRENRVAAYPESAISPLYVRNEAGELDVPADFPGIRSQLFTLAHEALNALLEFYALPVVGTVVVKRNRLALHIGLRV